MTATLSCPSLHHCRAACEQIRGESDLRGHWPIILHLAHGRGTPSTPAWRELLLENWQTLQLGPSEMLAAIEGNHLTGQRRRRQDEAHRRRDFLRAGAATQRHQL